MGIRLGRTNGERSFTLSACNFFCWKSSACSGFFFWLGLRLFKTVLPRNVFLHKAVNLSNFLSQRVVEPRSINIWENKTFGKWLRRRVKGGRYQPWSNWMAEQGLSNLLLLLICSGPSTVVCLFTFSTEAVLIFDMVYIMHLQNISTSTGE